MRRLTEPGVEHRQEDVQEKVGSVLHAPPPIPAEDKKVDRILPAPLDKVRVRMQEVVRTGNINTTIRNNVFLFGIDTTGKQRETRAVEEIIEVEPYLLV